MLSATWAPGREARLNPWGLSLLLPFLSSCAPCENPLNNKKKSHKHKYRLYLKGCHRSYNPAKGPLGSFALVGFFPILQDHGGRRGQ